tara:strand:- start:336 stop:779 length:444 start_codon:yes stop_codon:yes gene_type:complete
MIEIFTGNPIKVAKDVNDFMEKQGKDLPVRTDIDKEGNYVATVFYNGVAPTPMAIPEEKVNIGFGENTSSDKIGALWVQKDKSVRGKINEEQFNAFDIKELNTKFEQVTTKSGKTMLEGDFKGTEIRIIENAFKKTEKHPDYIVFKK